MGAEIHLTANSRCRPISRVTTAGQRHDSLAFESVMARIRIRRRGPEPDPAGYWATRPTPAGPSAPTCGDAGSRPPSPSPPANKPTGYLAAATADGHHSSTPRHTTSATPSSAPATNSTATAPWPPETTHATTCSAQRSISPRSEPGSATPSHDPQDRPQSSAVLRPSARRCRTVPARRIGAQVRIGGASTTRVPGVSCRPLRGSACLGL